MQAWNLSRPLLTGGRSATKQMRLYNLTSEKWALDNLRNRRIKISTIEDLNDPFELQGLQLSKKEYRVAFRRMKQQLHKNRGILLAIVSKNPAFEEWYKSNKESLASMHLKYALQTAFEFNRMRSV